MARPGGSFASFESGAEPAKAAGIAPRLEPGRRGRASAPAATRNGVRRRGFGLGRRAPGKRQGLRAAPRSERGFRGASASARFLEGRDGLGPASFGRATGEVSASMRALEKARLRPGRIRQGKRGSGSRSCPSDPTGIGEGPSGLSRDPPGTERGFAASLRTLEESDSGPVYEARSKAAQREMASPPSDGSQSWDKWGPVATPAPIMIPAAPF